MTDEHDDWDWEAAQDEIPPEMMETIQSVLPEPICERCDAWRHCWLDEGIVMVHVHHEDDCPKLELADRVANAKYN